MKPNSRRPNFILAAAVFLLLALPGLVGADTVVIPVSYRNAAELEPFVQNMISPGGYAGVDVRTNAFIIKDTPEKIQLIRDLLKKFDQPVRQAKIYVRFNESRDSARREASASGRVSGDDWSVSTGPPQADDGIDVRLEDQQRQRNATSDYFVRVMSGSTAYIVTGEEIPYRQEWVSLHGHSGETIVFKAVETGMDVKPIISGDQVTLEIVPRISEAGGHGNSQVIRFSEAKTTMMVPLGKWVTIAGADRSENAATQALLARGSSSDTNLFSIEMMVEAE